jgi:hypothetical protein
MKREKEIKGNILIYCLFQISNICLSVLGFFTFGISIYLMVLSKSLNFMSIIFFFFGVTLIILAYYGCKMRNAPIGNLIYSVILTVIFVLDMISTIVLLVDSNVVTNIMSAYDVSDLKTRNDIQKFITINMKIVNDLLLIILSILVNLYFLIKF